MEICCSIGNRQVSDGHKLLAFASDRQMQASVAPDRLTAGEGNSRATWVVSIDIKLNESARVWRIWRNRQRWRRRCTHLPLATGDSIYPVGGNLHFLFFFFVFLLSFKSAWNVRTARVYVRRVVMRVLPPWPQPARRSKCRTKNLTCHDPGGACSLKRRMFETYVPAVWTNEEFQLALQILSLLLSEDLGMKRSPYEKNSVPFSMATDRSQIDHQSIWRAMRWSLQFEINFLVVTGKKIVWNSSMFLHF